VAGLFKGRYSHTLDSKGRLSIPSKFREVLSEHQEDVLILTNFDSCLLGFTREEWRLLEEKIRGQSMFSTMLRKDMRAFVRYFFSGASECPLDRQGRILISPTLREFAGLEKEVVLTGVANRIEIWSKERWGAFLSDSQENFEEIAAKLVDLEM
jgi:MraZ protein